jgi:hypothetical protein
MSTSIKRVERTFLLSAVYNERTPVTYLRNRVEYSLTIEEIAKTTIRLAANCPIKGLSSKSKVTLLFTYKGMHFSFSTGVVAVQDEHITVLIPEMVYKNLDRSFARVSLPEGVEVQCRYLDDAYVLPFPLIALADSSYSEDIASNKPCPPVKTVLSLMAAWAQSYADGVKMISFKDTKPTTTEENILAERGKTIYLPSVQDGFPSESSESTIVTEKLFQEYVKSHQLGKPEEALKRFFHDKASEQIRADIWVPLLFHEYVIGCIRLWKTSNDKQVFDKTVLENARHFAADMVIAMKASGYFSAGYLKDKIIQGKIADMSASGFRLAYPVTAFSVASLRVEGEIAVKIITPKRTISTTAKIVRQYKSNNVSFLGCRFINMEPEDMRFFFECIYGKPFTDSDAILSGAV